MGVLKELLAAAEARMAASLVGIRARHQHGGTKGSAVESEFRELLRNYLPRRLSIGHGEVIDTAGRRSCQCDVIIATEDHPFTFSETQAGLFFVEGVAAVGEVKTQLTRKELSSALDSSRTFRELTPRIFEGAMCLLTGASDQERFLASAPWFVVALESSLAIETIAKHLREQAPVVGATSGVLDAVFVLDRGWVINLGDGQGVFTRRLPSGEAATGWHHDQDGTVLLTMMEWLAAAMPRRSGPMVEPILTHYIRG